MNQCYDSVRFFCTNVQDMAVLFLYSPISDGVGGSLLLPPSER